MVEDMSKMSLSEMIMYSTVLIKCQYTNGTRGSGTGFIINLCDNKSNNTCVPVIITNNHVVAGSVETVFEFCKADENGKPVDTEPFSFIYPGDAWIHHPDKTVDLCCLLLAEALTELLKRKANVFYIPLETTLIPSNNVLEQFSAMEDVVMVGYPIGLSDTYNHKPIIRRGITSSHPQKNYQGKRETLLDMACYPGSSGSPVFILNQGAYPVEGGIAMGNRIYLLGVLYGGHEFDAQGILQYYNLPNVPVPITRIPINLGIMIKAERILEFEAIFRNIKGENDNDK